MSFDYMNGYCAEYAISLFRYLKHLNKEVKLAVLLGERDDEYSDEKVNVNIHSYVQYNGLYYMDKEQHYATLEEVETLAQHWRSLAEDKWSRVWDLQYFNTEEELRQEFASLELPLDDPAYYL
jgi:hypothetical protein